MKAYVAILVSLGVAAAVAAGITIPLVIANQPAASEMSSSVSRPAPTSYSAIEESDPLEPGLQSLLTESYELYLSVCDSGKVLPYVEMDYTFLSRNNSLTKVSPGEDVYVYSANSGMWDKYKDDTVWDVKPIAEPNTLFGEFYIYTYAK